MRKIKKKLFPPKKTENGATPAVAITSGPFPLPLVLVVPCTRVVLQTVSGSLHEIVAHVCEVGGAVNTLLVCGSWRKSGAAPRIVEAEAYRHAIPPRRSPHRPRCACTCNSTIS